MTIDDFFQGAADDGVRRIRIFTDRDPERTLVLERIEQNSRRRFDVALLTNYRRAATNVTAIFGEGGIGKTALTRDIMDNLLGDERTACVAYIDLGDFANHSFETVLMRIRGSLAEIGASWPGFDLVFAHYWTKKHPGVSLVRFLDHAGFLTQDQRTAVRDQVTSILDGVLGGTGLVGAGYRLLSTLKSKVSEARLTRRLHDTYPPFSVLLAEDDPDKILAYLPALLAYDLENVIAESGPRVVCILDTFEYVQAGQQERGSLEDMLAGLAYLVPNMSFLVGSRLPLKWAHDTRSATLTFGGRDRWPDLVDGGVGQLQLSGLGDEHADALLAGSLLTDDAPAMPAATRRRVIRGSYGLPLHLELSVNWYRDRLLAGEEPDLRDIGQTFPELVLRIMRDLSSAERDILRAAAILEAFGPDLVAATLPAVRGIDVARFLERSFVTYTPASWLQYSMHQSLRRAVVLHDRFTVDAWTPQEWRERIQRAMAWVEGT